MRIYIPLFLFFLIAMNGCVNLYDMKYVKVGADVWFPTLDGDVKLDSGSLSGTSIDIADTLDVDSEETVNVHAAGQIGGVTIDLSYFQFDFDGDNMLSRNINLDGQTFLATTRVDSSVEMQYASAKAKIGLLGLGPVAVGAIVGVNYVNLDGKLNVRGGPSGSETLEAPIPVVGAVVTFNQSILDNLGVFADAEISGLALDAYDIEGHFYEVIGRAGLRIFSHVKLGGGYRLIALDIEDKSDDFTWDLQLGGPFVFLEVIF